SGGHRRARSALGRRVENPGDQQPAAGPPRISAPRPAQSGRRARSARRLCGGRCHPFPVPMRIGLAAFVVAGAMVVRALAAASAVGGLPPPVVSAVALLAPAELPETLVRGAIGGMVGQPRSRYAVRQSIERLWSLGLFDDVWVEEILEPGGVRLRYHLAL